MELSGALDQKQRIVTPTSKLLNTNNIMNEFDDIFFKLFSFVNHILNIRK